jgi:hypothetical protein
MRDSLLVGLLLGILIAVNSRQLCVTSSVQF